MHTDIGYGLSYVCVCVSKEATTNGGSALIGHNVTASGANAACELQRRCQRLLRELQQANV